MKIRIALVGLFLLAAAIGGALAQSVPSVQGVWRVTDVVVTGAGATTNKTPQPNLYIFTKGHYSIVAVGGAVPRADYKAAANADKLTDAEKIARFEVWDPFTANSGTYQVSGNTLTTHPVTAKNPGVMGTTAVRQFKITGTTLTLVSKSPAGQPASETTIHLTRVE
jgi:hypothetical protein